MGYLIDTTQTLTFDQVKPLIKYLKKHGIIQFLFLLKKFKDTNKDKIYWGDETELHILNIDSETKIPRLQLNTEYFFDSIHSDVFTLQPEYGAWMVEAVPTQPYEFTGDPTILYESFKARRQIIKSVCKDGDVLFTGTAFPMLKVGDCFIPRLKDGSLQNSFEESEEQKEDNESSTKIWAKSSFADQLINSHPRYPTMCENIKARRGGEDVCIRVPIYPDEQTPSEATQDEPYPGFVHMNETLFGTGNTSMQVTFGTKNFEEARYLHDQLSVFSSIMIPLSAASAIFKGKLVDVDARWNLISESLDCRTPEERDPQNKGYMPKPRWSSISQYLSTRPECKEEFNDITVPLDREMMEFAEQQAKELGIDLDDQMIRHIGFMFIQDPLIVFANKIYVDDTKNTNHFENFQSTCWTNVRFKPPPSFDSEVGWRVELRTVEAQLRADEGVAIGMFSYFFAEMVMKRGYNFYIPISKVDENIARGHKRDAILTEKFWFRKDVKKDSADEWVELTIDEILHGKEGVFVGMFNLIFEFCKEEYGVDIHTEWEKKKEDHRVEISKITENMRFFEILSKRARGEIPTIAKWIRSFVLKHEDYKKDSVVGPKIAADLISAMTAISENQKVYSDYL